MQPTVTIIIPSYNHQDYVIDAIQSVLQQDYPNIDLIVIDDGSTDNSPDLINELHKKKGNFRYIKRENHGLVYTLSEGLSLAKGKYVCELASDDKLPENSISQRAQYLEENPDCIAVYTDGFFVNEDKLTEKRLVNKARFEMFKSQDPIPEILKGKGPIFATGLFNTQKFLDIGGFDIDNFRFYEDLDTPIRICLAGKIGYLHEPLFYKRQHGTNISHSTSHVRSEKVVNFKMLLQNPLMKPYISELKKAYISSQISLAKSILNCSNPDKQDIDLFRTAWPYTLIHPKLAFYFLLTHIKS